MSKELSDEVLAMLTKLAAGRSEIPEGDIVDDYAGGNIDDAYSIGYDHGEASLAKCVLAMVAGE